MMSDRDSPTAFDHTGGISELQSAYTFRDFAPPIHRQYAEGGTTTVFYHERTAMAAHNQEQIEFYTRQIYSLRQDLATHVTENGRLRDVIATLTNGGMQSRHVTAAVMHNEHTLQTKQAYSDSTLSVPDDDDGYSIMPGGQRSNADGQGMFITYNQIDTFHAGSSSFAGHHPQQWSSPTVVQGNVCTSSDLCSEKRLHFCPLNLNSHLHEIRPAGLRDYTASQDQYENTAISF